MPSSRQRNVQTDKNYLAGPGSLRDDVEPKTPGGFAFLTRNLIRQTTRYAFQPRPQQRAQHKVVAIDYGAKRNILRCLASAGCDVTVMPATTSAQEVLELQPDGVFLSNGPGDPAATGRYAVPMIQEILESSNLPIFGICLGHQMLALALGGKTIKMNHGHHGAKPSCARSRKW